MSEKYFESENVGKVQKALDPTKLHVECYKCGTYHEFIPPIDNLKCIRCGEDILKQEFIE